MSQMITNRVRLSRRSLLKGLTAAGAPDCGRAAAAGLDVQFRRAPLTPRPTAGRLAEKPIESRFVLWFNGNGIPERYWIPSEEGANYDMTPCLSPLAPSARTFTC